MTLYRLVGAWVPQTVQSIRRLKDDSTRFQRGSSRRFIACSALLDDDDLFLRGLGHGRRVIMPVFHSKTPAKQPVFGGV